MASGHLPRQYDGTPLAAGADFPVSQLCPGTMSEEAPTTCARGGRREVGDVEKEENVRIVPVLLPRIRERAFSEPRKEFA